MTDPLTQQAADGAPFLALDVLPEVAPNTLQLDTSYLDGPALLGYELVGWSNIICRVLSLEVERGATRLQGALTRAEAGTCRVQLEDTERQFDPTANADAVHPGTPVRLRAWGFDGEGESWTSTLFTGWIGLDLDVAYQPDSAPLVSFTASDVIARLAGWSSTGRPDPGAGSGDNLLTRTQRVVAEVGLPSTVVAPDPDPTYTATLGPSPLARGWEDIAAAEDAELGRVWVTAANQLAVRARGSELDGPVRGTLSDTHGEAVAGATHCCYSAAAVRLGLDGLVNRAIGARRVTSGTSAVVQADDVASQARWTGGAAITHQNRALELATDSQLQPWAHWLVTRSSVPELRVDRVTLSPDGPDAWLAAASTDLSDRWFFRQRPAIGAPVVLTLGVLGIRHTITPESWETILTTTVAPTPDGANARGWFVVQDSMLDGGDVMPPFGGPAPVPSVQVPQLVVLGDSYSDPAAHTAGPNGWPYLVAVDQDMALLNLAKGGAGYVNVGDASSTFVTQAAAVPSTATVVVVFGGYNDRGYTAAAVETAARAALTAVRARAPQTHLVVAGPQWPSTTAPPAGLVAVQGKLRAVAAEFAAVYVDPTEERWFADRPQLIDTDGIHPTKPAGQVFLADRLGPFVSAGLAH